MSNQFLDIKFLKQNAKMIHAFGLGFIQIKLSDTIRLHVYCSDVKITTDPEDLHDHRYNFESHILKGKLVNEIYSIFDGDTHKLSFESCVPGWQKNVSNDAVQSINPCSVKLLSLSQLSSGSSYFMEKDTFHRVETERCITIVTREIPSKAMARVITLRGHQELTCPFSVNLPEDILWRIVEREISDVY